MGKVLIKNISQLVTYDSKIKDMRVFDHVELLIESDTVIEIGRALFCEDCLVVDAEHRLVTPGFVDPHTHPVFYSTREDEFEMRVLGISYMEIARRGGGILNSAKKLQMADYNDLKERVKKRLLNFLRFGVTTVEAKSGYGLDTDAEIKSLRMLKELNSELDIEIKPTFLGAHEYPLEFRNNHAGYIDKILKEMLPVVAKEGLAEYCDVFCEEGVFSLDESRTILQAAKELGLDLRIHAGEFKSIGGAKLAAELGARSADHLVHVTDDEIEAMRKRGVVAVLLPATTFFLGSDRYAPAKKMMEMGVEVALSTDFNPGSSFTQSMQFVITLACIKMRMGILEALQAATYNSAKSLGIEDRLGSIEKGKQADFIIWKIDNYQSIPYYLADNSVWKVFKNGKLVCENSF
ncbi:MAG: imidazolonepropionase [Candidatus Neomarinimicrobiota bacterium]|nr:MAG: imidazolonepropionase [Candidatus Neomarinimicrobiota bacterium]